jgi:hypothetical protein
VRAQLTEQEALSADPAACFQHARGTVNEVRRRYWLGHGDERHA